MREKGNPRRRGKTLSVPLVTARHGAAPHVPTGYTRRVPPLPTVTPGCRAPSRSTHGRPRLASPLLTASCRDLHSEPDLSQAEEWVMGALLVSGLNPFLWKQRNAACKPGPKEPGWPCLGEPPGTAPETVVNSTQRPPRASRHPCPGKKFHPH